MAFSCVQSYDGWAHILRVRAIRCASAQTCVILKAMLVEWLNLLYHRCVFLFYGVAPPPVAPLDCSFVTDANLQMSFQACSS